MDQMWEVNLRNVTIEDTTSSVGRELELDGYRTLIQAKQAHFVNFENV